MTFSVIKCEKGKKSKLIVVDEKQTSEDRGPRIQQIGQVTGNASVTPQNSSPVTTNRSLTHGAYTAQNPSVVAPGVSEFNRSASSAAANQPGGVYGGLSALSAARNQQKQSNLLRQQCISAGKDFDTCLKMFPQ